jgi:copper chaperone CopZ
MSDTTTTLGIRGMTCANCVRHVEQALKRIPGVIDVKVDLPGGTARVTHAPNADIDAMVTAVDDAGYTAGVDGRA